METIDNLEEELYQLKKRQKTADKLYDDFDKHGTAGQYRLEILQKISEFHNYMANEAETKGIVMHDDDMQERFAEWLYAECIRLENEISSKEDEIQKEEENQYDKRMGYDIYI